MYVPVCRLLIFGTALACAGCAGEYEQAARLAGHQETAPAEANAEVDTPEPAVEERQSATTNPPPPLTPSPEPPRSSPPSTGPSIRLSAGVALPQSLPTGTAMGISVDYQFTAGQPQLSQPYIWVIEAAKAKTVKQPVQLSQSGTLQAFFPHLRPEHGPFHAHIESSDGSRLSPAISLR